MLTINLSELILTVINFFLLLFLLKRFLYTPLVAFMDARNARIEAGLEQERSARTDIQKEENLYEIRRKQSQEDARRIIREGHTADELRYDELIAQARTRNACDRKEMRAAERQRNEEEKCQLEEQSASLAAILADGLLDQFPDMPTVLVGNGLRLAVENGESTWDQHAPALQHKRELVRDEKQRNEDLFAPDIGEESDSELQKSRDEQRQLDEKWEELASLLAERLLCPGA